MMVNSTHLPTFTTGTCRKKMQNYALMLKLDMSRYFLQVAKPQAKVMT